MAIYRCNKCGFLAEKSPDQTGVKSACPNCQTENATYDTVFFVEKLLERYFAAARQLRAREAEANEQEPTATASQLSVPVLETLDLHNTNELSSELQHMGVSDWLSKRSITTTFDFGAVDTTGFFDEVALAIGNGDSAIKELMERVRTAQKKGFSFLNLDLSKKSQKEIQTLTAFCNRLYGYSFLAKSFYRKQEKSLHLTFQQAQPIKRFFDGAWLEWFCLLESLKTLKELKKNVSCARNIKIEFQNGDIHELDVFLVVDGETAICIESKTGEFRQSIEKCATLRRRLGINRFQFILCASDLTDELAKGLSATHDLTFLAPLDLPAHIRTLVVA